MEATLSYQLLRQNFYGFYGENRKSDSLAEKSVIWAIL